MKFVHMKFVHAFLHTRGVVGITLVQLAALLPPLAVRLWDDLPATLAVLLPALVIALIWDAVFASLRGKPILPLGLTTALVFTVLGPVDASPWQLFVVLSIGAVIGELVFGGRGFAFLSAPAVALALWVLSFPSVPLNEPSLAVSIATLPGAVLLLGLGLLPWRVCLSYLIALLMLVWLLEQSFTLNMALDAVLLSLFALTFLIADPNASSATGLGRIVQGVLAAMFVAVFSPALDGGLSTQALVFAALLASLAVPLIDQGAMTFNGWQRRPCRA